MYRSLITKQKKCMRGNLGKWPVRYHHYIEREPVTYKVRKIHHIAMTSYTEVSSMGGFHRRSYKVTEKQKIKNNVDFHFESKSTIDLLAKSKRFNIDTIDIIEHNSVWDFYKYINYDHRKNKYGVKYAS